MRAYKSTFITFGCIVALLWLLNVILPAAGIPEYLVPTPTDILLSIQKNYKLLFESLAITSGEALAGLLLAMATSFPLAVATLFLPRSAQKIVTGIGVGFQSMPLLAIAPLLTLWFGHSYFSKAIAST